MVTRIYYFTGTGNSLEVARELQSQLKDAELVPIAGLLQKGEKIAVSKGETTGIVFPMYCGGVPNIVVRFFEHINLSKAKYVFSLITEGGKSNANPLNQIKSLCEKAGHELNGSWWVQMPDNYIPMSGAIPKDEQQKLFEKEKTKVASIARSVESGEEIVEKENFFGKLMRGCAYKPFMKRIKEFDKKYSVSEKCVKCQTCVNVCPVNNIVFDENTGITWQHRCEGCMACIQFCPKGAISCGEKADKRERYHHPAVTPADMNEQKK